MTPSLTPKIMGWLESNCGPTYKISRLVGGRNNLLWSVESQANTKYVIKSYGFDGRDRLDREWSFLSRLKSCGVSSVPHPILCDIPGRLALFSFLPGKKLSASSISLKNIANASSFIGKVARVDADGLPEAKDAHSSLEGHVKSIEGRVDALEMASCSGPYKDEFRYFVANELRPFWEHTKRRINLFRDFRHWDSMRYFLSPSDFGFHNILHSEGGLKFLDFEYAGRDDLAKLLSDFRLCPQIKVKKNHTEIFCRNIINDLELDNGFEKRLEILTTLGRTKWVCIVLNVFLLEKNKRISNATSSNREVMQSSKLNSAKDLLSVFRAEETPAWMS